MEKAYDYVVVGGGTAGAIVASRLSEDPAVSVALLEWGPNDTDDERATLLQRYPEMLGSEYDLDYAITEQSRGNSDIRMARGRILGGTSSLNNMGVLPLIPADTEAWSDLGVDGWDFDSFAPYREQLEIRTARPGAEDRNACIDAVLASASRALGVPVVESWPTASIKSATGYADIGYDPATGLRSSSSLSYLHEVVGGRDNLHIILETRALAIKLYGTRATGVRVRRADGSEGHIEARREVIVSCGAIDTPKLLLLSGIGPKAHLDSVGVAPLVDLPGVGENLSDHAEVLVVFELNRSADGGWPPVLDAAAFVAPVDEGAASPQTMAHIFRYAPEAPHGSRTPYGYEAPEHALSITPNVARPKSRGTIRLTGPDVDSPLDIDFSYFTDPEGHDERILLAGIRMARKVAETEPFASWVEREVFPGPELRTDEELSERVLATHSTVCHAAGTCRMGSDDDPLAVLDSRLRVRGVDGLRVVDASAFPALTTFNPMVTVMMLAERAATLIRADRLADELGEVVGYEKVISAADELAPYAEGKSPFQELTPGVAVRVASVEDVAAVLRYATANSVPVVTRGGGFSLGGSPSKPEDRPIVLDTRKLNRVIEIDEVSMTVTAECGVLMSDLEAAVAERGFEVHTVAVPRAFTTLGGVLSGVCGGGFPSDVAAIGGSGQFVLGLSVVLPDGSLLHTNAGGSNVHRASSSIPASDGPHITQLFIGDGGSLGVKVRATLAIHPARNELEAGAYEFDTFEQAWKAVAELGRSGDEVPYAKLYVVKGPRWSVTYAVRAATRELLTYRLDLLERTLEKHGAVRGDEALQEYAWSNARMDPEWARPFIEVKRGAIAFVIGNREFEHAFAQVRTLFESTHADRLAAFGIEPLVFVSPYGRHAVWCAVTLPYDDKVPGVRDEVAHLTREGYELVVALGGWSEPHQGEVSHLLSEAWSTAFSSFFDLIKKGVDPQGVLNAGLWSTHDS